MPGQRNSEKVPDALMATAHLEERREQRYTVPIAIEVRGIDRNGEVFRERTLTSNVSEWGCGFPLSVELQVDDMIALRVTSKFPGKPESARQSLFQVRHVGRHEDGWMVGAWRWIAKNVWGAELEKIGQSEESPLESRQRQTAKRHQRTQKDADR